MSLTSTRTAADPDPDEYHRMEDRLGDVALAVLIVMAFMTGVLTTFKPLDAASVPRTVLLIGDGE